MKLNKTTLSIILLTMLTACGGSNGGSSQGSDKIFVDKTNSGPNAVDLPNFNLIESNVIEVKCGNNDITEDGFLTVSCLDKEGDTTAYALITCEAGEIGINIVDDDDYVYEDTCVKMLCSSNGNTLTFRECD